MKAIIITILILSIPALLVWQYGVVGIVYFFVGLFSILFIYALYEFVKAITEE